MERKSQKTVPFMVHEVELIYRPKFKTSSRPIVRSSKDAYNLLLDCWNMDEIQLKEEFKVLLFNKALSLLGIYELSSGGIDICPVDPRLLFAAALKANAIYLMLAHNHPSGHLKASAPDIALTQKIREGGKLLEITLLDHLIISSEGYISLADEGLI